MTVDIRTPRPDEWRAVRALRLRALGDAPDAFGSTLARETAEPEAAWRAFWLERPGTLALIAEDEGRLVGMAFGWPSRDDVDIAGLYGMWVDPVARRHGVGAALAEAVVTWARTSGSHAVELGVTVSNPGAVAFYAALGFVDTGERYPLREGSDLTIQVMTRPLGDQPL
jgi:GNAT superfamily N-acetyltransferase